MVKRLLARTTLVVAALTLTLLLAGAWLLDSRRGNLWLLEKVATATGLELEVTLERPLWSGLRASRLRAAWTGGSFHADALELDWRPWRLFLGTLDIRSLRLSSPRVAWQDIPGRPAGRAAARSSPARVPPWLDLLDVRLDNLQVDNLELALPQREPIAIRTLHSVLAWHDGRLHLTHRLLDARGRTLQGVWQAGSHPPTLAADVTFQDGDRSLQADLQLQPKEGGVAGRLEARIRESGDYGARVAAELVVKGSRLDFSHLLVTRLTGEDRVEGTGFLAWSGGELRGAANLRLTSVDLVRETGWRTNLEGDLAADLEGETFRADIAILNRDLGWKALSATAHLEGDRHSLRLDALDAAWLHGTLSGELALDGYDRGTLRGHLTGRHLDPAGFDPQLAGDLSFVLDGELTGTSGEDLKAGWDLRFSDSRLRAIPFTGDCRGRWQSGDLSLESCRLVNGDSHLRATGHLSRRLEIDVVADDLARFLPDTGGSLAAKGWIRRAGRVWAGDFSGHGSALVFRTFRLASLKVTGRGDAIPDRFDLRLQGDDLEVADTVVTRIDLTLAGGLATPRLDLEAAWRDGDLAATLAGERTASGWSGRVERLRGSASGLGSWALQLPAELELARERIAFGPLALRGTSGETLSVELERTRDASLFVAASWQALQLSHANPWLKGPEFDGTASGRLRFELAAGKTLSLDAHLDAEPVVRWRGTVVDIRSLGLDVRWQEAGLDARGELLLARGGRIDLQATSPVPGRLAVPEQGELTLRWRELPLALLKPDLLPGLQLEGVSAGEAAATLQPGKRFSLSAQTDLHDAHLLWRENGHQLTVPVERCRLQADWHDRQLEAQFLLTLPGFGTAQATAKLPAEASVPPTWRANRPWEGRLALDIQRLDLLAAFWPELIRRPRGMLKADALLGGTPAHPDVSGSAVLSEAAVELPLAGIALTAVHAEASLRHDVLELTRAEATSGEGTLRARGTVSFADAGAPPTIAATLSGERFTLLGRPNLQLVISPEVALEGRPESLSLSGTVHVPRMLVNDPVITTAVTASEDVVVVTAQARPGPAPLKLLSALDLKTVLGERVLVKLKGLDARLGGEVTVQKGVRNTLIGLGEIRVETGNYSAFGLNLPISRGRLLFGGGPVEDPALEVRAEKAFGEVRAGVEIGGTVRTPKVSLFSDPEMSDSDILSYLVLGRRLDQKTAEGESDALMLAAGALLSRAQSATLRDSLSHRLGIDELSVRREGSVAETVITVGKYLTPDIYISYGRGVSAASDTAQLRYKLNDRWEFESEFGTVSGADLYYRIELP